MYNNLTIHVVYIPFMSMYNTDENHTCRLMFISSIISLCKISKGNYKGETISLTSALKVLESVLGQFGLG